MNENKSVIICFISLIMLLMLTRSRIIFCQFVWIWSRISSLVSPRHRPDRRYRDRLRGRGWRPAQIFIMFRDLSSAHNKPSRRSLRCWPLPRCWCGSWSPPSPSWSSPPHRLHWREWEFVCISLWFVLKHSRTQGLSGAGGQHCRFVRSRRQTGNLSCKYSSLLGRSPHNNAANNVT